MHFYWRVQQDLNCLGEVIHFHDPSLIRLLKEWMRKNFAGIAMAEGQFHEEELESLFKYN